MMRKTNSLFLSLYGVTALCSTMYAQENSKPNLILIMTDQHRFDAMGCAGNDAVLTPNIDALSRDGNRFINGYSSVPSSTPARANLLTGMSQWNHGMLGYGEEAERYEYETPRMLNALGYTTAAIGKMHWFPQDNRRGLDLLLTDESGRVDMHHNPHFVSDYRKWFNTQALGLNPDSTGIGWNDHAAGVYKLQERLHPTVWTGQMAVETINNYQGDEPLYLKVSFARPHSPYDPPQRVLDKVRKEAAKPKAPYMGDWVSDEWLAMTDTLKNPSAAIGNFGDEYAIKSRQHYNASITFVDEQIGEVIKALKEKGMYENSLIVFVADHGDMLGDHALWRKTYAYEGSAKIPFIVKLPESYKTDIKRGATIDYPVELRDVLPTFLDINGAEKPERMDGMSLLDIYDNKKPEWREFIDLEHSTAYWADNYWCALTDGNIKYIWFLRSGEEQLFDLTKDKGEEHELSGDKRYSKVLEKMRAAMVEHLSVRGEEWVKDGKLQRLKKVYVYGKNFPKKGGK